MDLLGIGEKHHDTIEGLVLDSVAVQRLAERSVAILDSRGRE